MIYPMITAMMIESARIERSLTPEQKAEREVRRKRREELDELARKAAKIRANICPECEGKLDRGKKDKKKNYARKYTCRNCSGIFHVGGEHERL